MGAPLQADFRAFEDCLDLATIQDLKTLQSARCGHPLPGTRPRTRGEITLRTLQQPLNTLGQASSTEPLALRVVQ